MIGREVQCPKCRRRGIVHCRIGCRMIVTHTCPGPWTFVEAERLPRGNFTSPFRAIFMGLTEEDIKKAGWQYDPVCLP